MRIRVNRQLLAEVREVASDQRTPRIAPYTLGYFDAEIAFRCIAEQYIRPSWVRTGTPSNFATFDRSAAARQQAASAEDGADG